MRKLIGLVLVTGCAQMLPVAQPEIMELQGFRTDRFQVDRPTLEVVTFYKENRLDAPVVRAVDSLQISVSWTLPTIGDQYGQIDTVRVVATGGAHPDPSQISKTLHYSSVVTNVTVRLPMELAGLGPSGATGDMWQATVCVAPKRRGVYGRDVCVSAPPIPIVYPAPPELLNLIVTSIIRTFP